MWIARKPGFPLERLGEKNRILINKIRAEARFTMFFVFEAKGDEEYDKGTNLIVACFHDQTIVQHRSGARYRQLPDSVSAGVG